ncbi:hypothetical protein [Ureibacillus sinduriensis]|uniref:hypothetical protein n=1 Tax=Ureibacillus sinduriensis TaxID=561440 RepID=UPI0015963242|nr:hypothetical protein [Ureibacillus sinduriensis]
MIIQNLALILQPFLPFATDKIKDMLDRKDDVWSNECNLDEKSEVCKTFVRTFECELIEEELAKLMEESTRSL